jgi:mono/diheme cytochrome c family protein
MYLSENKIITKGVNEKKRKNRLFFALIWLVSLILIGISAGCAKQQTAAFSNKPETSTVENKNSVATNPASTPVSAIAGVPQIYTESCAKCHGAKGEGTTTGKDKAPELIAITTRRDDAYTADDLLGILNNPNAYGLNKKMPSFKDKLTEEQKQEIIRWLKTL